MDLSNLKMTLKAYQKISKSVLSQFVTRPELDDAINNTKVEFDAKLEGYVEEIPVEFKDNGKTYGRQYKKWVEIDVTYKNLKFFYLSWLVLNLLTRRAPQLN